ncbi:hypothetical protein LOTGIDRAFT_231230 [Lottia gigantea]|uniref:CARD domain-containing protein n=1 Tax=Lottia gigantea TaxID=225164 RepID=V4AYV0_LOTGI|nr:hypothetical protein LOTGIDRAFT_231230 [Lottia gigantea]ESO98881.1 hypothetical protein LOTGIDRAFT_231230 [Lottia gigantea]
MMSKYRSRRNGSNGRTVRFNSGAKRDPGSHLRYTTDNLDTGFSLQKYSGGSDTYPSKRYTGGLDNYPNQKYSDYRVYHDDDVEMSYPKLRQSYGVSGKSEYGGYPSYLDLSYRKLPPSYNKTMYSSQGQLEPRLARGILKKNEAFLRRHLVLSRSVLEKLVDVGLIGDVMKRRILHMDAMVQVAELIRLLDDRGLGTLHKFLQVLRETGSGWIADVLLDTDAIEYEDLTSRDEQFDPVDHYENRLNRYNHGALKRYDSADDLAMAPTKKYGPWTARAPSPDSSFRRSKVSLHDVLNSKNNGYPDVRGQVRPGFFLANSGISGALSGGRSTNEVPKVINNLESHFRQQTNTNEVALSSLKQEEMAIRELMDQNRNEQQKVRKNQYTLMDINQKLKDVNIRTNEIYDPTENAAVSSYRLNQLNQIPWATSRY